MIDFTNMVLVYNGVSYEFFFSMGHLYLKDRSVSCRPFLEYSLNQPDVLDDFYKSSTYYSMCE